MIRARTPKLTETGTGNGTATGSWTAPSRLGRIGRRIRPIRQTPESLKGGGSQGSISKDRFMTETMALSM
jgi:hypothetical protein